MQWTDIVHEIYLSISSDSEQGLFSTNQLYRAESSQSLTANRKLYFSALYPS